MQEITVAAVQMYPLLGKVEDNLIAMGKFVDKICTEQKVDLIVFPELSTTGYELGLRFTEMAERVPGQAVNLLAQRAADYSTHIVFGLVSKEKVESILYNAAVVIGPDGELLGEYRKLHLPGEERLAFRPGYRLLTFEASFGEIGVVLGWDLAFPEAARSLALEGAEVLCVCANWGHAPNVERDQPVQEWRTYVQARALENAFYVVASNRIGEEYSYRFVGESMVVGPRGEVYASIDEEIEGYAVATVDLDAVRRAREELQLIQCRVPAAYRSVVRKY
ncbi:MAG: carbon-nitrogen hydrolase family protein [Anaerolineae bacterium]|nr:carbon-nitrogen hydrolase family protein [Anaerolineae bacterium]